MLMNDRGDARRVRTAPTGRMLLKESWHQLKAVRGVAALPVIGGVVGSLVFLLFAAPGIAFGIWGVPDDHTRTIVLTIAVLVGAVPATVAMTFFQGAIVSAALQQAAGQQTSLGLALAGARQRLGRLLQWGFIEATVNVVLSLLRDRNNIFTSILSAAGGLAWSAATFLALPAVMSEDLGPFAAVKRSASLLKSTWGSAVRVTVRFTLILLPAFLGAVVIVFIGTFVMVGISEVAGVAVIVLGILLFIVALALASSIKAYITTQLYLFASGQPTSVSKELVVGSVRADLS